MDRAAAGIKWDRRRRGGAGPTRVVGLVAVPEMGVSGPGGQRVADVRVSGEGRPR